MSTEERARMGRYAANGPASSLSF